METISKSNDLLARLRSVTLEDELQLSDLWPKEKSQLAMTEEPSFQSDRLSDFMSSWNNSGTSASCGSSFKNESKPRTCSETKSEYTAPVEQTVEKSPVSSIFALNSVENQENPFAKMSRKGSGLTWSLPKLGGWLMNTCCFGILGVLCGGSLTAWSILAKSGSHAMTSFGLSLTISGLLMLVFVVICQTALHTSGQT